MLNLLSYRSQVYWLMIFHTGAIRFFGYRDYNFIQLNESKTEKPRKKTSRNRGITLEMLMLQQALVKN